jgi:hypothetical protein
MSLMSWYHVVCIMWLGIICQITSIRLSGQAGVSGTVSTAGTSLQAYNIIPSRTTPPNAAKENPDVSGKNT